MSQLSGTQPCPPESVAGRSDDRRGPRPVGAARPPGGTSHRAPTCSGVSDDGDDRPLTAASRGHSLSSKLGTPCRNSLSSKLGTPAEGKMTLVATTEALHPRHILASVIASALLSVVAFIALSPSTAQADQQWNGIHEWTVSPHPFTYTREPDKPFGLGPYTFVRTKTHNGPIKVDVTENPANGVCVMLLRASNGSRLALKCWLPHETGIKTMATSAPPQRFTVWAARRGNTHTPTDSVFDGFVFY